MKIGINRGIGERTFLVHLRYKATDKLGSCVRLVILDFSKAFDVKKVLLPEQKSIDGDVHGDIFSEHLST